MALFVASFIAASLAIVSAASTTAPVCPKLKVYVADEKGALIVSENGGETWARRDPAAISIWSIWAAGTTIYLGTDSGLCVSKNGGHTWTMQYFRKTDNAIYSVFGVGNRIVLAGSANVTISEDLGKTWTVQTNPQPRYHLQGVYATAKRVFVGLGGYGLALSDDGGATWRVLDKDTPFQSRYLHAIAGSGDDVYAEFASEKPDVAAIAISNDGGESWGMQEVTTVAAGGRDNSIAVDGATVLVGTTAGLAMSNDVWNEWDLKTTVDGLANNSTVVAAFGESYFAGTDKGLSISRDRGNTWTTPVTPLADHRITAVFAHCVN